MNTPFSPGSVPTVQTVMGPQVDFRFWSQVLPTAPIFGVVRPPVSGVPAEVTQLMELRSATTGYTVSDQQFYYP